MHPWVAALAAAVLASVAVASAPTTPPLHLHFGQEHEVARDLDRQIRTTPRESSVNLICAPVREGGGSPLPMVVTITVRGGQESEEVLRLLVPRLVGSAARDKQ